MLATAGSIEAYFAPWGLNDSTTAYLRFHSARYAELLRALRTRQELCDRPARLLDVGSFLQTEVLRVAFPAWTIDTLSEPGGAETGWGNSRPGEQHLVFDLNEAHLAENWPAFGPYDVVVMAEVIEHLYTAPTLVLGCVAHWLRPGGVLALQTPNAARLEARAKLVAGRHPYEQIRESRFNAGHFREYTVAELRDVLTATGFQVERLVRRNHFTYPSRGRRAIARLGDAMPAGLRDGITALAVRRDQPRPSRPQAARA